MKNSPKLPTSMPMSIHVGTNDCQLPGRKVRSSDRMITNRSNHMPMFTKIEMMKITQAFDRTQLEPEQLRRDHVARDHRPVGPPAGPNARFMKQNCSYGLPPYQAMKNSVR